MSSSRIPVNASGSASPSLQPLWGPILTLGFASSVAVWIAALVTHLPWINLEQRYAGPGVLAVWLVASIFVGTAAPRRRHLLICTGSGLLSAMLGLLILGSMLVEPADARTPAPGASGLVPNAGLMALGFLALGATIGAIGGLVGKRLKHTSDRELDASDWLSRLAVVTVFATVPLLIVGGAVTSTRSGMAIIGWPDSFRANMFLYPISLMAHPARFFEHTHRLLGSLVGLTTLALMLYTFIATRSSRVRWYAVGLFVLVVVQGLLGGRRVLLGLSDPRHAQYWALIHGVCAQVFLALAVAFAARVRPLYQSTWRGRPPTLTRRGALFVTLLLPAALLQLSLGATYRHLGDSAALLTHIAFSVVLVLLSLMSGFMLASREGRTAAAGTSADLASPVRFRHAAAVSTLRRVGSGLVHVTILQFLLGWAAFWAVGWGAGGSDALPENNSEQVLQAGDQARDADAADDRRIPVGHEVETATPEPIVRAVIKTAHQANGAALLALATLAFMWGRWAAKSTDDATPTGSELPGTPTAP